MWDVIKKNKFSVGILTLVVIAVIIYSIFFMGGGVFSGNGQNESEPAVTVSEERVGEEIFELIERLESINFNPAIFDRPEFASLVDFGFVITPRGVGRNDPFAPIGRSSGNRGLLRQATQ